MSEVEFYHFFFPSLAHFREEKLFYNIRETAPPSGPRKARHSSEQKCSWNVGTTTHKLPVNREVALNQVHCIFPALKMIEVFEYRR